MFPNSVQMCLHVCVYVCALWCVFSTPANTLFPAKSKVGGGCISISLHYRERGGERGGVAEEDRGGIFAIRQERTETYLHLGIQALTHTRLTPEETTACFHDSLPPREPFYFFKHISSGTLSDITTDIHTLHSRLLKESAPKENVLQVTNCYLEHFSKANFFTYSTPKQPWDKPQFGD